MAESTIEHRLLRPALEFAVRYATESRKAKSSTPIPGALKQYLGAGHLGGRSLGPVRRTIEANPEFRVRVGAAADVSFVGEIGMLWLTRPEGWRDKLAGLAVQIAEDATAQSLTAELRRSEKRRAAAESVAARRQAEVETLTVLSDELRAELRRFVDDMDAKQATIEQLKEELVHARQQARHCADRAQAAHERAEAAERERDDERGRRGSAESSRDEAFAERAVSSAERAELARLAAIAETLADQLGDLSSSGDGGLPTDVKRHPLGLPGGVLGSSAEAARFLLRTGSAILVDGYNVAKLAWPRLGLAEQRRVLLDGLEGVARRFDCDLTVVFDGADVIGASADRRRIIRVVYSPAGVIADDAIRDEVSRLPVTRSVVVVTNDREIVASVRRHGANTLRSEQLVEVIG